MIQDRERRAKVGVFAIGLDAYWGQLLSIGNTNSRLRFALPPAEFMNAWCEQGPTHHCALGVGHHSGTLRKVARLLGLEFVAVGEAGRG